MLTSIILQLTAQQNGRFQGSTGRALHGFWFQQWRHTNHVIADQLHSRTESKPFTLSPLLDIPRPKHSTTYIKTGDTAWVRFTTFDAALSQHTMADWLPKLPQTIDLIDIPWSVQNIALMPTEHPWAAQTSFDTLYKNAKPHTSWTFHIKTPLAIHIGTDAYMPFPLPGSLIKSWWHRWHTFSPYALPSIDLHTVQEQLFVSHYRLKTIPVRHGRRVIIGCVGDLTLRAGKLDSNTRRTLDALAHFATFCGGGSYTTQGMGIMQLTNNG